MNMESGHEGSRGEEVGSHGAVKRITPKSGASSYRSIVTEDMLASCRAKYSISRSVIMIILEPSDQANTF